MGLLSSLFELPDSLTSHHLMGWGGGEFELNKERRHHHAACVHPQVEGGRHGGLTKEELMVWSPSMRTSNCERRAPPM